MVFNLQRLSQSPVILSSGLLLLGTAVLVMVSIGVLLGAFLYSPQPTLYTGQQQGITNAINPSHIGDRNFFGLAQAEPELQVDNLPETPLALVLRGAFVSADQTTAGAIIQNSDTKVTDHYYVGETLAGEAELKAIYADRVVLTRNGLLETLYFPDMSDRSGIGAVKNTQSSAASSATESIEEETARKRREAIRERIKQLRNR